MSRRLAILTAGLLLAAANLPMLAQTGARATSSAPLAAPSPNGFDQWADLSFLQMAISELGG